MLTRHRGTRGPDGVQAVVLRAPGSFESLNFDDVLTGLCKGLGQSGSKASRAFQRPDPTPRRSLVGPSSVAA